MITRRNFLLAGTALLLLPPDGNAGYTVPITILHAPFQTIGVLQRDLFPGGGDIPSPQLLHALGYLGGVLRDPMVDDDEKRFIENGARWLDEEAKKAFDNPYYRLSPKRRQRVLENVIDRSWADSWIWTIFSYLFEALLGDPVYGINTHESGWHWLQHVPGYPRPKVPFNETI